MKGRWRPEPSVPFLVPLQNANRGCEDMRIGDGVDPWTGLGERIHDVAHKRCAATAQSSVSQECNECLQ